MNVFKKNKILRILFGVLIVNQIIFIKYSYGSNLLSVEVFCPQKQIRIGEPLFVQLTCIFKEQQKKPNSEDVFSSISQNVDILIEFTDSDKKWLNELLSEHPDADFSLIPGNKESINWYPFHLQGNIPETLNNEDETGLRYSSYFLVYYNPYKKDLIFDKPGTYKICGLSFDTDFVVSNPLEITVSSETIKDEYKLEDPNYCDFLMGRENNLYENSDFHFKMISNLKRIVNDQPDSLIANLAAARIGMELYREYEQKRIDYRLGNTNTLKQLWAESVPYLEKGLKLPDDFLIREKILFSLAESEIEIGEKDYTKAISYLEELSTKYPNGRFGKSAVSGIEEVKERMVNDPNWSNRLQIKNKKELSPKKPLGVTLPIAGAAVAVIVIAGLFLFLRKTKPNKAE